MTEDFFYSECYADNQNEYKQIKIFKSFKTLYYVHRAYHIIQFTIHNINCEREKHSQLLSICHCSELKYFLKCLYFMDILAPVNLHVVVILLGQQTHQN
jgi:hypothetical protein